MWIRLMGCVLVILGCSAVGCGLVEQMKKRLRTLKEMKKQLIFLQGEIRCGYKPLYEIFRTLERKSKKNWKGFYEEICEKMESKEKSALEEIWRESMESHLPTSLLKEEERRQWRELGENIGYLDVEMQVTLLSLYIEHFTEFIRSEQEGFGEKAKLYQTLGVMSGVFISVVFI